MDGALRVQLGVHVARRDGTIRLGESANLTRGPNPGHMWGTSRKGEGALTFLVRHFSDLEHGTEANRVPYSWRSLPGGSLTSAYSISPLAYVLFGMYMFALTRLHPSRRLYDGEEWEALAWILQGGTSFWCDVWDLGRPGISHPVDRVYAMSLTLQQAVKWAVFAYAGRLCGLAIAIFPVGIAAGAYIFWRSARAVDDRCARDYFWWHTAWHYFLPVAAVGFYSLQFLA